MPIIFYSISIVLFLSSLRFNNRDGFLDKNSSNSIKGFFILLIVFSHILNYFPYNGLLSYQLGMLRTILGQLIVSMFFFISGFGIIYSVEEGGNKYKKSLLTNRLIRILVYTTVSLIPYFIYSACLGKQHGIGDYFLSLIGLASFGNETWFLFAIIFCYLISGLVYLLPIKNKYICPFIITLFVIGYIIYFYIKREPVYRYDTIMCFIYGMFISLLRNKINNFLSKRWKTVLFIFISLMVVVVLQLFTQTKYSINIPYVVVMWFSNFSFCTFFICLTKIFVIKSCVLNYFGKASFAIFIMHKFIICCFVDLGTIPNEWANYFVLFTTSVGVGLPFYYIYKVLDKYVINYIVNWNRNLAKDNL